MTQRLHELLLSELRMVTYRPGDPDRLTDELLCEAVTLNENLLSLGFTLRPDDMLRLAASPSLEGFYDAVAALVPQIEAEPMYPGFPRQVMEMSAAEFRLHQLMHYFSTYDLELLTGREVHRGWLPEYDGEARDASDVRLLDARVIELVAEDDAPIAVLKALLNRRERLTNPELDMVMECAPMCAPEQLTGLTVRFKENLDLLFPRLMAEADRAVALNTLRALCAHSGDVLRLGSEYLGRQRYHLRTADKRLLVKLLESYPAGNLRENLMLSRKARERNLVVLQHLDYNQYSRSAEHREAVRALRNGELQSWHSMGEALIQQRSPEALNHLAQRPGYMVRMLNRLLSLGYESQTIADMLMPRASEISTHLLVKTIRSLTRRGTDLEGDHLREMVRCQREYERKEREIRAKFPKLEKRKHQVRAQAEQLRAEIRKSFNDDAYQAARDQAFEPARRVLSIIAQKEAERRNKAERLRRIEAMRDSCEEARLRIGSDSPRDVDVLYQKLFSEAPEKLYERVFNCQPEEVRKAIGALDAEIVRLKAEHTRLHREAMARFEAIQAPIREAKERERAQRISRVDRWEQKALKEAEEAYARETAKRAQALSALTKERDVRLVRLQARYQTRKRMSAYDGESVDILMALLKEHFRQADTPLKGKKVWLDMDQFDLEHSTLETEDRSKDGGYIRSGISYRIPDDAKYVRFFVYWNDSVRVDVDLHAGGKTLDGEPIHVGWNADFRECGVVYSGDITHSDAAEYIDIDLSAPIKEIYTNLCLYSGRPGFGDVETCFVGMMAVSEANQEVRLYDPANCFFTQTVTQNTDNLFYGYIDVQNRFVRYIGKLNDSNWDSRPDIEAPDGMFSLRDYLDCLFEAQEAECAASREEADVVLTMGKNALANGLSLVDSNFFLES